MAKSCGCKYFVCEHLDDGWTPMADKTKMILRNDPAKERKKLGKVKDLFDNIDDGTDYDFDVAMGVVKKIKIKSQGKTVKVLKSFGKTPKIADA